MPTTEPPGADPTDPMSSIPAELRADWQEYVSRTVADMRSRPVLMPRDRSLVTVAALTAPNCPIELRNQLRRALVNGLSTWASSARSCSR
jgi:alkylhydroperoxidase/carboxymuconolactone decarboxylase family protein YurZ